MRRAALVLTLVAAACLTACAHDDPGPNYSTVATTDTPTDSPSPTGSPSPTVPTTGPNVSPGETPPVEPAAAGEDDSSGALAFEAFYVQTIDWVYATSEPGILSRFYSDACENCATFRENLEAQTSQGATYRGSRITLQRMALVTNDGRSGAKYAVSGELTATPISIVDAAGATTVNGPATTITVTNWLAWVNNGWAIVDQGLA